MNYDSLLVVHLAVFITAIVAAVRIRKTDKSFLPFFIYTWIAGVQALLSIFLDSAVWQRSLPDHLLTLSSYVLLAWQLQRWGGLFPRKRLGHFGLVIGLLFLLLDGFVGWELDVLLAALRMTFSMIIVFMSINVFNVLIITERETFRRNAVYLMATGLVIFFTLQMVIELFWVCGVTARPGFINIVQNGLLYFSMPAFLIYIIALLWSPTKRSFSMPF